MSYPYGTLWVACFPGGASFVSRGKQKRKNLIIVIVLLSKLDNLISGIL
jgi:hypothetical protein